MLDKMGVSDRRIADFSERVLAMISRQCGPIPPSITPTSRLREDLAFDSIHRMTLACEIEEAFDVLISDDAVDAVATVQDVIDAVALAVSEKEQEADRG